MPAFDPKRTQGSATQIFTFTASTTPSTGLTAMALHALGRQAEFEAAFSELRERWGEQWPSEIAHVYAWTGDVDAAFEWLDKSVAQNEDGLTDQFNRPLLIPLHDDPRWLAFRERTGTSEAKLAAIEFEVTIPE